MSERLFPDVTGTSLPVGVGETPSAVGRINLGGRRYVIRPASREMEAGDQDPVARFNLGGVALEVVEAVAESSSGAAAAAAFDEVVSRLSGRELEIAVLVAQGHANKVIAHRLQISEWTVATYLRRIFLKLDVETRAAMVFRCASLINARVGPALQGRRFRGGAP